MAISRATTNARITGKPAAEFLLMRYGVIEVEQAISDQSFVFTRQHAQQAVNWFAALGRRLMIDYEHQSLDHLSTRKDGLKPAAGWIGRMQVRGDGLWACDVAWTDRARTMIAAGEYHYFSPVIYWHNETGSNVKSLGPVGLTNDPAMKGVPMLVASNERTTTMYVSVLASRPFPRTACKAFSGDVDTQTDPAGEIISAIEDFAARVDWDSFRNAVSEELVEAVKAAFEGDDRRILQKLGEFVEGLRQGQTARDVVGGFMIETGDEPGGGPAATSAAYARAVNRGLVNIFAPAKESERVTIAKADDSALEREWAANRRNASGVPLQREFGSKAVFVAFRKAEAAGRVRIKRGRV